MAEMQPYSLRTPVRTADGMGGSTDALGPATTIWGAVTIHETNTTISVDIRVSVTPDDLFIIDATQYRAGRIIRHPNAGLQLVELEKVARPIEPLEAE